MENANDLARWYWKTFGRLSPDRKSRDLVDNLWGQWEQAGGKRPDNIDGIINNVHDRDDEFFRDLVAKCRFDQRSLGKRIVNCEAELYDYQFRKVSTSDGCVVLYDAAFTRLLLTISLSLMQLAVGGCHPDEKLEIASLTRESVEGWFAKHLEFRMPIESIQSISEPSYEASEMGVYLFNAIFAFALAHEIGHFSLCHRVKPLDSTYHFAEEKQVTITLERQSYREEFEADDYAFSVFKSLQQIDDPQSPLLFRWWFEFAPLLLFDIYQHLDSISEGATNSKNHPSPEQRKQALLKRCPEVRDDPLYIDLLELLPTLIGAS